MNLTNFKQCMNLYTEQQQNIFAEIIADHHNIIILGNGGSNAVASHIAQDYTKQLGKHAFTFSDASMLTCYANDYGWENAYTMFLKHMMLPRTLVILISSSGKSMNILNAAAYVTEQKHSSLMPSMITMSGFEPDNPLRTKYTSESRMHFYVPSNDYGIVEIMHNVILHSPI